METNEINYYRHVYNKAPGTGKPTEYHLIKNILQNSFIPDVIHIEPERDQSKLIKDWLTVKEGRTWIFGNRVTGLQPTNIKNVFEGNLKDPANITPESLIFFEFSKNRELLVIDLFKGFYTNNPFAFRLILESHKFLLQKKAAGKSCL